jgi:hypothetical protein
VDCRGHLPPKLLRGRMQPKPKEVLLSFMPVLAENLKTSLRTAKKQRRKIGVGEENRCRVYTLTKSELIIPTDGRTGEPGHPPRPLEQGERPME